MARIENVIDAARGLQRFRHPPGDRQQALAELADALNVLDVCVAALGEEAL